MLGDQRGVFGVGDLAAAQPRLLVQLLHQPVAGVVVGDARGVAQQVLNRHLPLQRHEVELAVVLDADLLVGEFRNEFRDGVAEQEMAVLDQHHDADRDDRLGHREDAEDRVVRHRRARRRALPAERFEPADLAAPRHHHGRARQRPLVDLALERIRHALQSDGGEPSDSGLAWGSDGVCGVVVCLAAVWAVMVSPVCCSCCLAWSEVWRRTRRLEQGVRVTASPLQSGRRLCLKRREPAATLVPCRSVAQLVEHRSPKPGVAGSSPATPASKIKYLG